MLDKAAEFIRNLRISKKTFAILLTMLFVLSLAPLYIACFFSAPILDDYNFGVYSHLSYINGNGFFHGVIESCSHFYNNWQGFYTSNFLASIQLFNINVNLYCVFNIVVITLLILSLFYFSKSLLVNTLKMNVYDCLIITIPIVEIIIQFMPSVAEGFYWMDGSLATFILSVSLFNISYVINYRILNKRIYAFFAIISLIIISGDSLITFITLLLLFFYFIIHDWIKLKKIDSLIITLVIIYVIGIAIALMAPGNKVRLDSDFGTSNHSVFSLIKSIVLSLFYSVTYFGSWFSIVFISALILSSVVFYKYANGSKYSFKYPLLVFIGLYLLYAARMSVQLFTGGYLGAPRQFNQYYIGFVIIITISVLYFVGWLSKRDVISFSPKTSKSISVVLILFIVFIAGSGCFNYGIKNMSTISTGIAFKNGDLQQYHSEMMDRIQIYEDDSIENAEVKPLTVYPTCYCTEPLTDDVEYWTNKSVAKYYGKESVKLITETD